MEQVTISSKGQIAIPKAIREELNLSEGAKLALEVQGQQIVLSKEPAWKKLEGAAASRNMMRQFAAFRKRERKRENSRP
jgi:AbrB family looped-hinge helix DNA binding protein